MEPMKHTLVVAEERAKYKMKQSFPYDGTKVCYLI
jgi:hypothetical protein